ncbi:hypothetical protein AB3X55_06785 [Alphaproteobacteria bacterium LSUCC0719]
MSKRVFTIPLLMVSLVLVACTTTSSPPPPVSVQSAGFGAIALNARQLEVIENWQMPIKPPYIGHLQQPYPGNLVSQWATQVLMPAGGSGEMVLDITRAAVTKVKLPPQTGLANALSDQQDSEIRVEFEAKLMWLQPVGGSQAMIKLASSHSVTIPESSSANDVQRAVNDCLNKALAGLDNQARIELAKIDNVILP